MLQITVFGLGKIGLPLAVQYASKGHKVFGVDINEKLITDIESGICPISGEEELADKLKTVLENKNFQVTLDSSTAVSLSDAVVVVVPLYVSSSGEPQFDALDNVTDIISKNLKKDTVICYETTVPVGTTKNRFSKIIERNAKFKVGIDFYLAFSPERVFSGRIFKDLRKYPKIVGGVDDASSQKASDFYNSVLDFDIREDLGKENGVWVVGDSDTSEFVKIAETTYRDVNIALSNEFSKYSYKNKIDFANVIEACNSQPYSYLHQSGISVGGHCIPIYPQFYLWNDPNSELVKTARRINSKMPGHALDEVFSRFPANKETRIAIMGITYREEVKEIQFSGFLEIINDVRVQNSTVLVHDELYSKKEIEEMGFEYYNYDKEVDLVIFHTHNQEYNQLEKLNFPGVKLIIDGRHKIVKSRFSGIEIVHI